MTKGSPTPSAVTDDAQVHLTESPTPTPEPSIDTTRAVFIGDSYTQGTGASDKATTRWTSLVSINEGWQEINLGRGGTGYVTTSGVNGCGKEYCPSYPEMVAEAVASQPDLVVVAGGQNDQSAMSENPNAVIAAINATYSSLRAALPGTRIIAVGPSTPEEVTSSIVALDEAVRAAAEANGAEYISLLEPAVLTLEMIAPDGSHANDAGHAAIAARIESLA
jgi:lysophospholipase L1-like esterase